MKRKQNNSKTEQNRKKRAAAKKEPAKRPATGTESIEQWRRSFALGRHRQTREDIRRAAELEQLKVFVRRTKSASGKKAQRTSRTRAYYPFSKEYPAAVDPEGFRAASPQKKKRAPAVFAVLLTVLAFCLSFVLTKTGMLISAEKPAAAQENTAEEPEAERLRLCRLGFELYAGGNAEAIRDAVSRQGCNGALFEVKSESGYVNLSMPDTDLAGFRAVQPEETLAALKKAGVKTCAYISCFRDPLAAAWDPSMAVRRTDAAGGLWTDNAGQGWLNPYSLAACDYLAAIVEAAANAGFDLILLDNVCFSTDSGTAMAYYPGESETGLPRNAALGAFVEQALAAAGKTEVILMCRTGAFDPLASSELPAYGGNLLQTGAGAVCVDARLSRQPKNLAVGADRFADPAAMPFVFTLTAGDYAVNGTAETLSGAETLICVEAGASLEDCLRAASLSAVSGYVIW